MQVKKNALGFSLIELMLVTSIIGILVALATPNFREYRIKAKTLEAHSLVSYFKSEIQDFYRQKGRFPKDNNEAGIPSSDKIIGNYVDDVAVEAGAFHVRLGNKIDPDLIGKVISIRPLVVPGSPRSPISWVCGIDDAPNGMEAIGENRTTVPREALPSGCI